MTPAKPAILFLVPDARLRDIYVSRFERDGWEVDAATNLTDAERRAVQLRPSILFIHHTLLESTKTTFKRLRSLPTLLKTRIVIADKHLSREAVDEVLKAGAHEVVMTAHLTPQALVKRMNQLIEADL
jgi:DNA-binding response OmpR family regulator